MEDLTIEKELDDLRAMRAASGIQTFSVTHTDQAKKKLKKSKKGGDRYGN